MQFTLAELNSLIHALEISSVASAEISEQQGKLGYTSVAEEFKTYANAHRQLQAKVSTMIEGGHYAE